jgi:hypothetical protein
MKKAMDTEKCNKLAYPHSMMDVADMLVIIN